MTLGELPAGARVVVDANILLYHFAGRSRECTRLLGRIESGEVVGFLPAHIALEVLHRLMLAEALEKGLTPSGNPTRRLSEHADLIRLLTRSVTDFADLPSSGLRLEPLEPEAVARVPALCLRYGLLAHDAALVAFAEHRRVPYLASADEGLAALQGIRVARPGDL